MGTFERLVRFEDSKGQIQYGELSSDTTWDANLVGLEVKTYPADTVPWAKDFVVTEKKAKIAKVLSPLAETPIIIGIGLNYRQHAVEAGFPIPKYPVVFNKYADALAGPYDDISINKEAGNLDFEGELCVVIGKKCKNLSPDEDPLSYVLGYTVGNDVSSRLWQLDKERSAGQHGYAKSFDQFAPIGPVICTTNYIKDPSKLHLKTRVNGVEKQNSGVDDLIFDVQAIIRHLSRGMTLREGTVIMTGTPSGVAAFEKPPGWLKDSDVVEVEISEIGKISNKMVFEM